ncbi:MAG: HAD-IA family hydrolase|nr:HAD-IA family hydrolase [Candidatus Buchananbacteria bacterium]
MQFKAIIFDRDGVIIDTEPINLDSAIKAFSQQGIELTEKEKDLIIGTHPVDYQEYFKQKYPDFDFAQYRQIKRELYLQGIETAPLFNEIIDLIKKLSQQNITLGLVTSSARPSTDKIIQRAGLQNVFQAIVSFEDCEQRKPAPDCYLKAAAKLNLEPKDCLVIEDTSIGLQAAKKAGMTCYVIPTKTTQDQDFSQADRILQSGKELKNLI